MDAGRIDSVKVEDVELGKLPETGGVENNGDTPEQGRGGRRHGGGQKNKPFNRKGGAVLWAGRIGYPDSMEK